jgi:hypothetical protein
MTHRHSRPRGNQPPGLAINYWFVGVPPLMINFQNQSDNIRDEPKRSWADTFSVM